MDLGGGCCPSVDVIRCGPGCGGGARECSRGGVGEVKEIWDGRGIIGGRKSLWEGEFMWGDCVQVDRDVGQPAWDFMSKWGWGWERRGGGNWGIWGGDEWGGKRRWGGVEGVGVMLMGLLGVKEGEGIGYTLVGVLLLAHPQNS